MIRFEIAKLNLLYLSEKKVQFVNRTSCLKKFERSDEGWEKKPDMIISVMPFDEGFVPNAAAWKNKITGNKIWEFWEVDQEHFGLRNPPQKIYREFIFTKDFQKGRLYGKEISILPQDLEIVFFSNWLASFGDIILHASAILTEKGVTVFCGESGVGKSTLVSQFEGIKGVEILGEDQVILRNIDGEIEVFGTPWHFNPNFCSEKYGKLKEIVFLERRGINYRESLKPITVAANLLKSAFIPFYRQELLPGIVERLSSIAENTTASLFSYTLDMNPVEHFL
jgi:hypothetical protein